MALDRGFIKHGLLNLAVKKALLLIADAMDAITSFTEAVTATAAEINLLDIDAQTETIAEGGVVSVTKRLTKLTQAGAGAITLAAPPAAMLGHVKIIEQVAGTTDAVTLAFTNIDGQSAGTGASFNAAGEALVLVAGVAKWHIVSEAGGVTLA